MAIAEKTGAGPGIGALVNDGRYRAAFYQIVVFGLVFWLLYSLVLNTQQNLETRGMTASFDFLFGTAGFAIAWTPLDYKPNDTYFFVYWVGIVNTLIISVISIILATVLGFFVGILRLSKNWLISQIAAWYVEFLRNTPLLLQILFWYLGAFASLPRPKSSIHIFGLDWLVLNNRGFYFPYPEPDNLFWLTPLALLIGLVAAFWYNRKSRIQQLATGVYRSTLWQTLGLVIGLPVLVFVATGMPLSWEIPALKGFNYRGGTFVLPSMCSVLVAMVVYHSAYAAEMVRAGIQSVSHGQTEAAYSLGLKPNWTLRLVIIPQAMRAIVPPMISLWMNIVKNSSLAIAIGFPDLVAVFMQTSLNQSGHAIEIVGMVMLFYMTVRLTISGCLNIYNSRIQLKER